MALAQCDSDKACHHTYVSQGGGAVIPGTGTLQKKRRDVNLRIASRFAIRVFHQSNLSFWQSLVRMEHF